MRGGKGGGGIEAIRWRVNKGTGSVPLSYRNRCDSGVFWDGFNLQSIHLINDE